MARLRTVTAAPFPGSSRLPITGTSWIFKPSKLVCKLKSLIPLQRIDCHRGWENWENKIFHLLMSPGCGDDVCCGFEMPFVAVTSVGKGKRKWKGERKKENSALLPFLRAPGCWALQALLRNCFKIFSQVWPWHCPHCGVGTALPSQEEKC